MRVTCYCVAYNEEDLMPFYLRHCLSFADRVVVYDNMSSDRTRDVALSFPKTEVRSWDVGGLNDAAYLLIKNNCYKEERGKSDWVVVGDVDEILWAPDIRKRLAECKEAGIDVPSTTSFDMVSDSFPSNSGMIYDHVKTGLPSFVATNRRLMYSKRLVFNPAVEIRYEPGCHFCSSTGVVENDAGSFYVLHYKYLGLDRLKSRHRMYAERLSSKNKQMGWGAEYSFADDKIREEFEYAKSMAFRVLG